MNGYTFYIKGGKAIAHPVGGGTIEQLTGQHRSQAVNVQPQGNKVIVTYEDGAVIEHPWPRTGGTIRFIVQPQRTVRNYYTPNVPSSSVADHTPASPNRATGKRMHWIYFLVFGWWFGFMMFCFIFPCYIPGLVPRAFGHW